MQHQATEPPLNSTAQSSPRPVSRHRRTEQRLPSRPASVLVENERRARAHSPCIQAHVSCKRCGFYESVLSGLLNNTLPCGVFAPPRHFRRLSIQVKVINIFMNLKKIELTHQDQKLRVATWSVAACSNQPHRASAVFYQLHTCSMCAFNKPLEGL